MATLTLPPPIPSSTPNYRRQKSQFENKPSLLLSAEENNCIFQIIGSTSQTLATAVVRLAFPDQNQSQWQILETGVVCLIRDEESKSYYIEVYSMQTKSAVFSQEIYNEFAYNIFEDLFLSFEGDESMVGLHFADKTECFHFCEALNRKLKRQKRDGRKRMTVVDLKTGIVEVPNATQSKEKPGLTVQVNITYGKTKKPKQKLRKTDIGRPSDFRHIQHVGFDANRGLDFNLTDAEFQAFFDRAGISQNELQDENTRRFIQKLDYFFLPFSTDLHNYT
ncbi:unnamed protein product [Allacma fusca]|uniref:Uncharacterized protein n=1 Tax=Allacma fusca TaxID=39272 RepID=A0A8J2P364_9HEXA|nr:unnamed protein product [Allacma fusca]